MSESTLSNGARWQDGIERGLEQNTKALNALALRMQQQVDRLDTVINAQDDFRTEMKALRAKQDDQGNFLRQLKWGLSMAAAVIAAAWGLTTKWVERQFGL